MDLYRKPGGVLPSSPIKGTVRSAKSALEILRRYTNSQNFRKLELVVSKSVIQHIFKSLSDIADQDYTVLYDTSTSVLHICPMPTPIHDIIINFMHHKMNEWMKQGFLTPNIYEHISFMSPSKLPKGRHTAKRISWRKDPDCTLGFGILGSKTTPRLRIEVGFSQPYDDLVNDVREWLDRDSRTCIAIFININEDTHTLRKIQASEGFHCRSQVLLDKFGNTAARNEHGLSVSDFDSDSDQALYDSIDAEIVETDWVGPLEASLEVWGRDEAGASACREVVEVLPTPKGNPTILMSDLVPPEFRYKFPDLDFSKKTWLDMTTYESAIKMAVHDLARDRALGFLRPRVIEDNDYVEGSQSSQGSESSESSEFFFR
ncbi:hypothetical protein V8E54_006886 [Elaphomyces granulatus]